MELWWIRTISIENSFQFPWVPDKLNDQNLSIITLPLGNLILFLLIVKKTILLFKIYYWKIIGVTGSYFNQHIYSFHVLVPPRWEEPLDLPQPLLVLHSWGGSTLSNKDLDSERLLLILVPQLVCLPARVLPFACLQSLWGSS